MNHAARTPDFLEQATSRRRSRVGRIPTSCPKGRRWADVAFDGGLPNMGLRVSAAIPKRIRCDATKLQ